MKNKYYIKPQMRFVGTLDGLDAILASQPDYLGGGDWGDEDDF